MSRDHMCSGPNVSQPQFDYGICLMLDHRLQICFAKNQHVINEQTKDNKFEFDLILLL